MAQLDASRSTTSIETPGDQPGERRDEAARAFAEQVGTEASEFGAGTKQLAEDFADEARDRAQTKLSGGKEHAAVGLGSIAEALRNSGDQLRSEDQQALPQYLDGAAEKLERASQYLRDTDLSDVIQDVENFARREPALFVGGAFALGLIGGRFLKSSRKRSEPGAQDPQHSNRGSASSIRELSPKSAAAQRSRSGERTAQKPGQEASKRTAEPSASSENAFGSSQVRKYGQSDEPSLILPDDTRAGDVG